MRDQGLRDAVQVVAEEGGYEVQCCDDAMTAVEVLRVSPTPFVVILLHGGVDREWAPVLSTSSTLPSHAYLLLSTRPQAAPVIWNRHTQRDIPVVAAPFDIAHLLGRIAGAAATLLDVATLAPVAVRSSLPVACPCRV